MSQKESGKAADNVFIKEVDFYPPDSFKDGIYWADLPKTERWSFIRSVNRHEFRREWAETKATFLEHWYNPIQTYFTRCILPGAGIGLEGYVLFSVGNLKPLYKTVWPKCFSTYEICDRRWVYSIDYLEIAGILCGQLLVGIIGDKIGRRWGYIQNAVIMFLGLVLLTTMYVSTPSTFVITYAWLLFFYGIGVGGDYPMTATMSMEATESGPHVDRYDRMHRGRRVVGAFLMQGWGQFLNQAVLILLLVGISGNNGNGPYTEDQMLKLRAIQFAIVAVGTAGLVYYRACIVKYPIRSQLMKQNGVTGYNLESVKQVFKHYWHRLIATCGTWFINDVFFYGNKLFQHEFIQVIAPDSQSIMTGWKYNLINVSVALAGYYAATLLIDHKLVGRKRLQTIGFLAVFLMFTIPGFALNFFIRPENIKWFQTLYFLSSFFNQCGANSVTFLIAAECFPSSVRATAHGLGAAWGKAGALLAAVVYNHIDTQTKFYFVPGFGIAGAILSIVFLPDTTGLDLKEADRRFQCILQGREYHGVAIHPRHLSLWERWTGVSKGYDLAKDRDDCLQTAAA